MSLIKPISDAEICRQVGISKSQLTLLRSLIGRQRAEKRQAGLTEKQRHAMMAKALRAKWDGKWDGKTPRQRRQATAAARAARKRNAAERRRVLAEQQDG